MFAYFRWTIRIVINGIVGWLDPFGFFCPGVIFWKIFKGNRFFNLKYENVYYDYYDLYSITSFTRVSTFNLI